MGEWNKPDTRLCRGKILILIEFANFSGTLIMIRFKWKHFKPDIILMLVWWYIAYSLSYRDIDELILERRLKVDHSTINRWVIEYAPPLEESFCRRQKRVTGISWRMDETYIPIQLESTGFII